MTHQQIVNECEALGLKVTQEPATGNRAWSAKADGPRPVRVYWSTSYEGGVLAKPRFRCADYDTHLTGIKSLRWYVRREQ